MALKLYYNPHSRAAMTRYLLEELEIPYELAPVAYDDGSMRTPEFLALNPMGKIPVLDDDGVIITETTAIAIYLADKYKAPNDLAPGINEPERGEYLRWLAFVPGAIEPAMAQKSVGFEINRMQAGWGEFDLVVDVLKDRLARANPYLLGERFTAADAVLGGALNFAMMFEIFPKAAELTAYVERITSRPAFARAIAPLAAA